MIGTADDRTVSPEAGPFRHGRRNFFCRSCGGYTSVGVGEPDPARCTTPGCRRPYGFGSKVPPPSLV